MLEITLDNRELSFLIWGIIGFLLMLSKKEIRRSMFDILKILANYKILSANALMLTYITLLIYLLSKYNIWDISLLKATILWILFVALPLFFKANRTNQEKYYFKVLLKENLKIIFVLEFLINLYVFSLQVELIFLPFAAFIGGISAISSTEEKYFQVKKMTDYLIGLLGLFSIIYVTYNMLNDFGSFANYNNLKLFLVPVLLTILFIPAIYFQALFMNYEVTFVRLGAFCKDVSLLRYVKFRMVTYCNLNLFRAKKFSKSLDHFNFKNKKKFLQSFKNS